MRIIGVDPGSRFTGIGMIQKQGNQFIHIENGTLYLKDIQDYAQRLVHLHKKLTEYIKAYKIDCLAVENIFYHKNPKSTQKLGEVRGVIILTGAMLGLEVFEYTALQVKQAVTGYGKASKDQMQGMVRRILNLPDLAEENASDALGIAICHGQNSKRHLALSKLNQESSSKNQNLKELLKKSSFYR